MIWQARVHVLPKAEVLDPQGEAIKSALRHLAIAGVASVRSGRVFDLRIEAGDRDQAERIARDACERLLANTVVESFDFELAALADPVGTPS